MVCGVRPRFLQREVRGGCKNQRQTPNGKATGWFSYKRQATSYKLAKR